MGSLRSDKLVCTKAKNSVNPVKRPEQTVLSVVLCIRKLKTSVNAAKMPRTNVVVLNEDLCSIFQNSTHLYPTPIVKT